VVAKDSKNIAIATARDSFAMMTLAIVTMLFLPATFFATVFALPLLRWTEEDVMMPPMWLYMKLAVAITAAVFALWIGAIFWQQRRSRKSQEARERELAQKLRWCRATGQCTAGDSDAGVPRPKRPYGMLRKVFGRGKLEQPAC
jgi:hypothetical protein